MGDTMDSELRTRITHYKGCWWREGHHACAIAMVEQLQAELVSEHRLTIMYSDRGAAVRRKLQEVGAMASHEEITDLDAIARLAAQVEQLRRDIHDEQVRRDEWKKMYYQAIAGTEVERLQAELARAVPDPGHTYCAFCGAEYPQGTPRHGDGALTQHIMVCPEHPMREVEQERDRVLAELDETSGNLRRMVELNEWSRNELDRVNERAKAYENRLGKWVRKLAHSQNSVTWLEAQYNRLQNERGKARRERDGWCERANRAEALAQLVNEEAAGLLERLSRDVLDHCKSDTPCVVARYKRNAKGGYDLAAQIREALDDSKT